MPQGFAGGPETAKVTLDDPPRSSIDAIVQGTSDGVRLLANVIGLLVVMVALVTLFNGLLGWAGRPFGVSLTLQGILGTIAWPLAWAIGIPDDGDPAFLGEHPLYRHDLKDGTRQVHDFGGGRVPGEFVFVPRAVDAPEGDGWLIGYVIDTQTDTTDLVILDAGDMALPPVATVQIPHRIPPGFHGNWLPDA